MRPYDAAQRYLRETEKGERVSTGLAIAILVLVSVPFVISVLKGHYWKGITGFFLLLIAVRFGPIGGMIGLVLLGFAVYRSFAWAYPNSAWARLFYDGEKKRLAAGHHSYEAEGEALVDVSPQIGESEATDPPPDASDSEPPLVATDEIRNPWKLAAILAISFAVLLVASAIIIVIANNPPDEKLGTVRAPGFNSHLAGGGLSSNQIGTAALLSSVRSSESTGFQILQDGIEENAIEDFRQVQPRDGWDSEFEINDSALSLRFKNEDRFWIEYPRSYSDTADQIFTIASRYGFLSGESSSELAGLVGHTETFLDTFLDRSLTIGVPESDLASEAASLTSGWDSWISENSESNYVAVAKARRTVLEIAEAVSENPNNNEIDEFNAAIGRLNNAIRKLRKDS